MYRPHFPTLALQGGPRRRDRMTACARIIAGLSLLLVTGVGAAAGEDRTSAVFAGGCFWCMEEAFDGIEGVIDHQAGFAGGHVEDPSYSEVVDGGTGHYEVVRIEYDPDEISYRDLLHVFWRNVDPLDDGGQFCDRGDSYRTAIFVDDDDQRAAARASKAELTESGRFDQPVVTPVLDHEAFYPAEEYHQDYFTKRPLRYKFYVTTCGRYDRLEEVWGDEARPGHE